MDPTNKVIHKKQFIFINFNHLLVICAPTKGTIRKGYRKREWCQTEGRARHSIRRTTRRSRTWWMRSAHCTACRPTHRPFSSSSTEWVLTPVLVVAAATQSTRFKCASSTATLRATPLKSAFLVTYLNAHSIQYWFHTVLNLGISS